MSEDSNNNMRFTYGPILCGRSLNELDIARNKKNLWYNYEGYKVEKIWNLTTNLGFNLHRNN